MQFCPMDFVVSALANANADGITIYELMRIAVVSESVEDFDDRVDAFSAYTREPDEFQIIIKLPV